MINILLTARDCGAGQCIKSIYQQIKKDDRFCFKIMAADPAFQLLRQCNIPAVHFPVKNFNIKNYTLVKQLINQLKILLGDFPLDVCCTGVGGFDCGVDELAQLAFVDLPVYVLQDFWGHVNFQLGDHANAYFVMDEFAAEMTKFRTKADIHITGPIKYNHYFQYQHQQARQQIREKMNLSDDMILIGYFGNRDVDLPGYFATVEMFAKELIKTKPKSILGYRPHPGQSISDVTRVSSIFQRAGCCLKLLNSCTTEEALLACDVVVTCYSTCGFDNIMMNRAAAFPLAPTLYLFFNDELVKWYQQYVGFNHIPGINKENSLLVTEACDLASKLNQILELPTKEKLWKNIQQNISNSVDAASRVLETIVVTQQHLV